MTLMLAVQATALVGKSEVVILPGALAEMIWMTAPPPASSVSLVVDVDASLSI